MSAGIARIHRLFDTLLRETFDVREGETRRALLMQAYIFLIISCLLIIKPVSNSLFLSAFGAEQLPNAYILVAIFAAGISVLYARWLKKRPLNRLIIHTMQISIGCLLFFWLVLTFDGWFRRPVLYLFYVWVAIFAVISASQFWILANLVFNPREARRLFGFIGAGAIAGGIFGGYLTNLLAPLIGTENLLFICISFLALCVLITNKVWEINGKKRTAIKFQQQKRIDRRADNPLRLILSSRHLTYLTGLVGISVMVAKLVDYQFSAIASDRITGEDQLTAFFGFWLSNLNVVSLLIQLFVTRRVVGVFGVGVSLLFLPVGIFIGALAVLIAPALWSAVLIKISDGSLKQSINRAGMELLALPIPPEIKNQAKTFIDVFVDSLATGLSGFLLIFMILSLDFSARMVSLMIIILIALWIYLVFQIREEYINSFRLNIQSGSSSAKPRVDLRNESVLGGLLQVLESEDEPAVLRVLEMVRDVHNNRFIPVFRKLLAHPSPAVRLAVLKNIYFYRDIGECERVEAMILDPDPDIRTEALQYLFRHTPENPVRWLQEYLNHTDYRVRGAALLCAAREARKNPDLRQMLRVREIFEDTLKKIPQLTDEAEIRFTKINCARVIGAANMPELFPYLHIFLNSENAEILKAAIPAAAQTGQAEFVPVLIRHLGNPEVRKFATLSLAVYGSEIVDLLKWYVEDLKTEPAIRRNIPAVLGSIGAQKAVDVLIELMDRVDAVTRHEVIKALNQARVRFPNLKFEDERITRRILSEAHNYLNTLAVLYKQVQDTRASRAAGQEEIPPGKMDATRKMLIKKLEKRLDQNLERIFQLLGLKYPPEDIHHAYLGVRSDAVEMRANAVEFLDNLLDPGLKRVIIPILELTTIDAFSLELLKNLGIDLQSEFDCFVKILTGEDAGVKIPVLKLIGLLRDDRYLPYLGSLVSSPDPALRSAAKAALMQMGLLQSGRSSAHPPAGE